MLNFFKIFYQNNKLTFFFNFKKKIPWLAIFTSRPCIVIFIGQFSHNWGNYLFLTSIPTFLKDVLKFDMKSVIHTNNLMNLNLFHFPLLKLFKLC